ncbi:MAG: pilin [Candidatus Moraniibacteriota bacterium]
MMSAVGQGGAPSLTGGLTYTLLEKIPGSDTRSANLPAYLQALYAFTFWAIGIAAVLMLSVGGFMYVTSAGNTSRMGTAKTIIADSLIGLTLAILAWLFLYVINPDFINISLPGITPSPPIPAPMTQPGQTPPSPQAQAGATMDDATARTYLQAGGVFVNAPQPQTSLDKIPVLALDRVIQMKKTSSCSVTVTGGTESGHKSHGPNIAALDLRDNPCLDAYFLGMGGAKLKSDYNIRQFCVNNQNNPALLQQGVADCNEGAKPTQFGGPVAHYHFSFL